MSASDLQDRLDNLSRGATLKLEPPGREFQGPLVLNRPVVIDGQGGTIWAPRGPVLSIATDGVVELHNVNVEVTSKETGLDGEEACAVKVAPHTPLTLDGVSVRGNVIGLDTEEGDWRYPRTLHLGAISPGKLYEFKAKLVVPVPCSLKSRTDGLEVMPAQAQAGVVEVTLKVAPLTPGARLRGDILLQTARLKRLISVNGNVLKSADGGVATTGHVVYDPPAWKPSASVPPGPSTLPAGQPVPVQTSTAPEPLVPPTFPASMPVVGTVPVVPTLVVSKLGEGQFRTLSEAIRNAAGGTRIHVRPGLYKESLVLDRRLEIIGDGVRSDIIIESRDAACLQFKTDYAVVRGLTLRGLAGQGSRPCPAVSIPHGQLVLEDCDITSDTLAAVAVHGATADPILRHCQIHDSQSAGVLFYDRAEGLLEDCAIFANALAGVEIRQSANPALRRCQIHDGRQVGLLIHDGGRGNLDNCDVYSNALAGVEIARKGNPVLRHCKIREGQYPGLLIHEEGQGTAEDCDIAGNALAGVEVRSGGKPVLRRCQVRDGRQGGLLISGHESKGTLEDCNVAGNALAGVTIRQGSAPVLRRCKIHHGRQAGIVITDRGGGTIETCEIFDNNWAGVAILTQANPSLRGCQVHDGRLAGLVVGPEGAGTVEDCEISRNGFVGVAITGGASPTVRRCRIHNNGDVGLWAYDRAGGEVAECVFTANTRAALDVARGCTLQLKGNKGTTA